MTFIFCRDLIIVIHILAFSFHGFALILVWCFCFHTEMCFVLFQTNVAGHSCDTCKPNTFGLSVKNPLGCSRCYCYGLTQSCSEAQGLIRMWVSRLWSLAGCCLSTDVYPHTACASFLAETTHFAAGCLQPSLHFANLRLFFINHHHTIGSFPIKRFTSVVKRRLK